MVRNKAVVEMVQPRAAYSTNKTAFVKHMVFHSYTLKNFHRLATFGSVTTVCPDYRGTVWRAGLQNKKENESILHNHFNILIIIGGVIVQSINQSIKLSLLGLP